MTSAASSTTPRARPTLDAERLATIEARGWRAYYERDWPEMMRLTTELSEDQAHIALPIVLIERRRNGVLIHAGRGAEFEIDYYIDHGRVAGDPDKEALLEGMLELHSRLYGLPPAQLRESAEWRVKANDTAALIATGRSTDPEADWALVQDQLLQCYRSIQRELERAAQ